MTGGSDVTAAVILAAGRSSRMGRSKALLPWRGSTMLRSVAQEALASRAARVAVVLGFDGDSARGALDGLPVRIVENRDWESGLGSSLAAGIEAIADEIPVASAAVILLADQPLVTAATIDRLIATRESSGRPLVASLHGSELGVPALFASAYFGALRSLSGDHGAREILRAHAAEAASLDLPEARFDVDTPEDYERLASSGSP
ncbi:MAG: nucleotidyltransferase family protein [Acidobacteriota bacterium]